MDGEKQTEVLKGTVENITYQNELNSYTVCTVKSGRELVTVVGILPFLHEGEMVEFELCETERGLQAKNVSKTVKS